MQQDEDVQIVTSTSANGSSSSANLTIPDVQSTSSRVSVASGSKSFAQRSVCDFLQKECPELISDDVLNNDSFISGMRSSLQTLETFSSTREEYLQKKKRMGKVTELSKALDMIEKKKIVFSEKLRDAAAIKIDVTKGTHVISMTSQKKMELLTQAVISGLELANTISSTDATRKMKKRMAQVKTPTEKVLREVVSPSVKLVCYNTDLSWSAAYLRLEAGISTFRSFSYLELQEAARQVEEEFFLDTRELNATKEKENVLISSILEHFPVMLLSRKDKKVLLNVHELILDPLCLDVMLDGDVVAQDEEDSSHGACTTPETCNQPPPKQKAFGPQNKRGRKPLSTTFPTLVKTATTFIKQHSFAAHGRRRETTGTGTGVSLEDIRQHLLDSVPGLKERGISKDAVHHLMVAPRKNTVRAERYKGLVDAKVPGKRNQYRENSANQHFLFARVAYREELCMKFSSEAEFYSADDMNKIRMGPAPAVSRYHSMHRFFMQSDAPNLGDHDFPNPGYLIATSGYQLQCPVEQSLEVPEEYTAVDGNDWVNDDATTNATGACQPTGVSLNLEDNQCVDKLGRVHLRRPTYGPALLVLRATKFGSSSGMTHANDFLPVLTAQVKRGKTAAFIKVDNGPDWNVMSIVNEVYFCRLWRESGLDLLGLVSYAARWSAYNNIEHLWSPMSKKLASVILPSVLEGDLTSPAQNGSLTDEERKHKEAVLFDQAMGLIKNVYWKDAQFNGSKVETRVKECLKNEEPYDDYETIHQVIVR